MGKPKVLMIGPARSVHGGISGVVNNYYEAGLNEQVELSYIGTMVDGGKIRKLWQAVWAFARFVCKLPFCEIVHVNVASDASLIRKSFFIRLAKCFRKKIVIHQHGGNIEAFYQEQKEKRQKKIRKVFDMADVFLVLSVELQRFFQGIIEPSKVILFPNAVSVPAGVNKKYGQQQILFLGRLCKEKGLGELFAILPQLHEQFPKMRLLLGGVWESEELRSQAETMKEYVTELGWVQGHRKEEYLQQSDIFVFPTYFEGQPVSVLEAMAYQCGIIASGVGGIPQMIEDKKTGILIEPQNTKSLQDALQTLLLNPEQCRKMGKMAGEKVKREFSIEKSVEQLVVLYRKLVQQG